MRKNRLRWVGAGFLVAVIASLYVQWTDTAELTGFGGDNATYLLAGEHYSPWLPVSDVARFFAQHSQYPPLLPLLFAMTGGAADVQTAHLVVALTFILSLMVMGVWLRLCGASWGPTVALPTAFALMPGTFGHVATINSEVLYLLLSFCALAALVVAETNPALRWRWMGGSVLAIALALLTRTAGFALLGSALVFMCWRRRFGGALFLSLAMAPSLLWHWFGGQTRESYLSNWVEFGVSSVQDFGIDRLAMLVGAVADAWKLHLFGPLSGGALVGVGVLLTGLAGSVLRSRRGYPDGFYTLAYGAMLLAWGFVWPSTVGRLLFPIVPVLLFQAYWALDEARARFPAVKVARVLPALLVVVCIVGAAPNVKYTAQRFASVLPAPLAAFKQSRLWYLEDKRLARIFLENQAALASALREIEREVEPGECIYSVKPSIVGWYARRVSLQPPREAVNEKRFWDEIRAGGCRYVLGMNGSTPSFSVPFYPMRRAEDQIQPVKVWPTWDGSQALLVLARLKPSRMDR